MRWSRRGVVRVLAAFALVAFTACDLLPYRWDRGERIYRKQCARCHGLQGNGDAIQGMGNAWTDLVDDNFRYGGDVTSMENVIRDGVLGKMPEYDREEISREDMRALMNHLFKLRGDRPPYPEPES